MTVPHSAQFYFRNTILLISISILTWNCGETSTAKRIDVKNDINLMSDLHQLHAKKNINLMLESIKFDSPVLTSPLTLQAKSPLGTTYYYVLYTLKYVNLK